MPYITASIILQLLVVVSPALEKLQKEGEVGQARITQYTRYLTVGLAAAQAIGYTFLFRSQGSAGGTPVFENFDVGDRDPRRAVPDRRLDHRHVDGRADHPARHRQRHLADDLRLDRRAACRTASRQWWTNPDPVFKIIMPFLAIGVVAAVVFIQEGQRRIPIQYAKRVIGRRMSSGGQTYLPLRVNMAGVIPVIFAASIMAFPPTLGSADPGPGGSRDVLQPRRLGLRARRDADDRDLHVLLYGGHVQPGRSGRQPEEVRRVHPGRETRPADGRVPGSHPGAPDLPGSAVPCGRRRAPDHHHRLHRALRRASTSAERRC